VLIARESCPLGSTSVADAMRTLGIDDRDGQAVLDAPMIPSPGDQP
jgi:hypothetical protein